MTDLIGSYFFLITRDSLCKCIYSGFLIIIEPCDSKFLIKKNKTCAEDFQKIILDMANNDSFKTSAIMFYYLTLRKIVTFINSILNIFYFPPIPLTPLLTAIVLLMDLEDQVTVLTAASSASMTKSHVFFTFASNPYDTSQNNVNGISSSRALGDVFSSDPDNKDINILESLLIIAPSFPEGSATSGGGPGDGVGDANLRRRRAVRTSDMTSKILGPEEDGDQTGNDEKYSLEKRYPDMSNSVLNSVDSISFHVSDGIKDVGHTDKLSSVLRHYNNQNVRDNSLRKFHFLRQHSFHNKSLLFIPEIQTKEGSVISQHVKDLDNLIGSTQNPFKKNHHGQTTRALFHQLPATTDRDSSQYPSSRAESEKPPSPLLFQTQSSENKNKAVSSQIFAQTRGHKVKKGYTGSEVPSSPYQFLSSPISKQTPLLFIPEWDTNSHRYSNQDSAHTSLHSAQMVKNSNLQITSNKLSSVDNHHDNAMASSVDLHRERRAIESFVASDSDVDAIYDIVLLLSVGVHKHAMMHGDIPTPSQFMDAVENLTVQGRMGEISIGQDHQVAYDFKVYDFNVGQGVMEVKLSYHTSGQEEWTLSEDLGIAWPDNHVPSPDECFKQVPGCNDGGFC